MVRSTTYPQGQTSSLKGHLFHKNIVESPMCVEVLKLLITIYVSAPNMSFKDQLYSET